VCVCVCCRPGSRRGPCVIVTSRYRFLISLFPAKHITVGGPQMLMADFLFFPPSSSSSLSLFLLAAITQTAIVYNNIHLILPIFDCLSFKMPFLYFFIFYLERGVDCYYGALYHWRVRLYVFHTVFLPCLVVAYTADGAQREMTSHSSDYIPQ
jgi:hypothetical protein